MDFTVGKRRQYERLMKEKPGFTESDSPEESERPHRKQAQGSLAKPKKADRKRRRED